MSVITLLTDFGLQDEYAGVMKGVILAINPAAVLVDVTHQIDSRDVVQAAFVIHGAYRFFPGGSVHLVVVDPGVGTGRAILALKAGGHVFIAPDNGVLTLLLEKIQTPSLFRLTNEAFYLRPVSGTFHGRDIMAPVAAHVSRGTALEEIGVPIDPEQAVRLEDLAPVICADGRVEGRIVAVDSFGNLITSIDSATLARACNRGPMNKVQVKIGRQTINGLSQSYGNVAADRLLALVGSRGYLEIAVNQGSAARRLKVKKRDVVRLIP